MTNCSYQYTSCITEDSKEINHCFLKQFQTTIVLLHKSFIFPGSWCDLRRGVTVYVPPLFHQSPLQRNVSALSFHSSQPTCDTNRPLRRRECKQPFQERLSYKSVKSYATIPTGCMGNGYLLLFDRSSQSKPEGRRIHEHACSCYLSLLR